MSGFSGKYRLDARLGGGGMAEVFVGSTVGAEGFARKVAIKRVLPGYSENPAFARMFTDEARISSRLAHPNIVSVLDFDRDDEGRLYLVMELVYGKDLDALSRSGPLPFGVVIYVIAEALRGLGHAHDLPMAMDELMMTGSNTIRYMRGIVHRDVSPHNVLLSWEGAVKVSDFGIAKARSASQATASEMIKGKPAYMSPEQANGETLDGRSDLFAVGVMLWELLSGRRLFVADDTRGTLAAVLFAKIPKLRTLRADVPKDLERVAAKLLERDLPLRYQAAEDALADLLACADAPKDGAALLQRTLADRFPHEAPVRHSALRSRSGERSGPSAGAVVPQPPLSPTAVDALRSAPTRAMAPTPSRALPRRALAIVGGIVGVAVIAAIIASVTRTAAPPPTLAAGDAARTASATREGQELQDGKVLASQVAPTRGDAVNAAVDAPADAAPPAVTDASALAASAVDASGTGASASPPPDARLATVATAAPSPGAGSARAETSARGSAATTTSTSSSPVKKRTGKLEVTAFPALTVYVDGKRIRDTPLAVPLSVGRHTVRLVNRDIGRDETLSVTIRENQTETIHRE
ncbi:MAG: protein kinase [Kofleriaceae bacterium]|nr:protein kinase [Kofleriaceae bacterium]